MFASIAAAIPPLQVKFGRQDHQALLVVIEIDSFLQLLHFALFQWPIMFLGGLTRSGGVALRF